MRKNQKVDWRRKVNLNRKRGIRVMRELRFVEENYEWVEKEVPVTTTGITKKIKYFEYRGNFAGNNVISLLELIWSGVAKSTKADLTKKDHKIVKRLKGKLKEVTRFKDEDEDARIPKEGEQILLLEEDEFNMMKDLLDANKFGANVSEEVSEMWDFFDKVPEKQAEPSK